MWLRYIPAVRTRPVTLRAARPDEMLGCARVSVRSGRDLARRQGTPPSPMRPRDVAPALAHLQRTDPAGFQVAVQDGRIVAFASTILRGRTQFLSMFWALPAVQNRGVGRRLLQRAFEHPRPPAGVVRCVFASLDQRAQALYLKFGMRPRGMFYLVKGRPRRSPRPDPGVDLVQVGEAGRTSREMLAIAARYDVALRGARRDPDIRYVMTLPGARFFVARAGRATVGYAIANEKGRVGPVGVLDARYSAGLAWAVKEAVRGLGAQDMIAIVPGVNAGALDTLFRAGFRTEFFGAWMSSEPIGAFEGYLLAGGMLL